MKIERLEKPYQNYVPYIENMHVFAEIDSILIIHF